MAELALDDVPRAFRLFERELARRGARTTRSRQDGLRLRALVETWFRVYRPAFSMVLGEAETLLEVDRVLQAWLRRVGQRIDILALRRDLRGVDRMLTREVIPDFEVVRWGGAADPGRGDAGDIAERLGLLDSGLRASWIQALSDLEDVNRATYVGPVGEIREVFRGAIHFLAPDADVKSQPWFKGHNGRPTQVERVRFIRESGRLSGQAERTIEMIDLLVAQIARDSYNQMSGSLHGGGGRSECEKLVPYVRAILNEILPEL